MKKSVALVLLTFALVFTALVPSCSNSGVDKNQYELAMAELTTLRDKKAKAQMYGLFLDRLMWFVYQNANLPSRYQFSSKTEWLISLDSMAQAIADPKIISLLTKMKTNSAVFFELENYLIDTIITTLQ